MASRSLYSRLASIHHKLDVDTLLERFLNVFQDGVDTAHGKAWDLLDLKGIEDVPDRFLQFVSEQVGHEWDSTKSMVWNRSRIRDSINRHSYKGTVTRITDDMREIGAEYVDITDNASKLLVLSKQGRLSEPDAYMVTADFWHDGAYVLNLVDTNPPRLDAEKVDPILHDILPAGTVWYLVFGKQYLVVFDINYSLLHGQSLFSGDQRSGILGYGQLITDYQEDANIYLSWLPNSRPQKSYYPITWHFKGNLLEGTVGNSLLGQDVFLSFCPTINIVKTGYVIDYHQKTLYSRWGSLGEDLSLSYTIEPDSFKAQHLLKSVLFDCGPTEAVDTYTQYLSWLFDLGVDTSSFGIHQSTDQIGDFMDIESQITTETQRFAVAQGYLTGDSNLPGNMDAIDGNQGDANIPLTDYQAALQTGTQKTFEEIPS